ncbi:DUF6397 family protein [Streptomyces sp. SCSIO 30461]|uniref:DUF6397 family protein n=1 Tax=Streptomyces sp. SCSIO 30461 TaxID=3118085 RepID=UPI00387E5BDA
MRARGSPSWPRATPQLPRTVRLRLRYRQGLSDQVGSGTRAREPGRIERAYVERLRPDPPDKPPAPFTVPAARGEPLLADDPDEVAWHRMGPFLAVDEARAWHPEPGHDGGRAPPPRPGPSRTPAPVPAVADLGGVRNPRARRAVRRLLTRLSPRGKSPAGRG